MTMHKAIFPSTAEPDQRAGRGTRIPDVPLLLAVLAARQRVLPTATAMRSHEGDAGTEPAERMVRLLVVRSPESGGAAGAFNGGIARYLSGTEEGEDGVYRGA
ncbi:MAG TPA: hypothetical protein VF503_09550 [Sphingobium sp.]|uniref:hypothetical protein n=1 Tax=Sphingobium sp. TaxID=1912891 RepID=UPI002ED34032